MAATCSAVPVGQRRRRTSAARSAAAASPLAARAAQNVCRTSCHRSAADLPLIQHLQRRFARAMARSGAGARRRGRALSRSWRRPRRSCARTASPSPPRPRRLAPLVVRARRRRAPPPARRSIGRQHAERHRDSGCRRRVHDALRDGRGDVLEVHRVALMRQPRQTIASNRPVSAAPQRRLRNLERPGHRATIVTSLAGAPASSSAPARASSKPSVISSLNRDTTTAKRQPPRTQSAQRRSHARLASPTSVRP